jgi:hypothetical protein
MYLPTNPTSQVVRVIASSGRPMQVLQHSLDQISIVTLIIVVVERFTRTNIGRVCGQRSISDST